MSTRWLIALLVFAAFVAGMVYGITVHRYRLFPYAALEWAAERVDVAGRTSWAIGIYDGQSPFDLAAPEGMLNPVLSAEDVRDFRAQFVADPFLVVRDSGFVMFFEAWNRDSGQGDITYATSADGRTWEYGGVALDEPFHLSYPHVFEWEDRFYMIPESSDDFAVRLYVATRFPDRWEAVTTLLSGYPFTDATVVRYDDAWWMFVSTESSNILNLYRSDSLASGWKPHPLNPIVKGDLATSRPGGRAFVHDGELYRLAQDDLGAYGRQVRAFRITTLTDSTFAETMVPKPIVTFTGTGWNAEGMHQVDLHDLGDRWIAAVDGRPR